MRNARASQPAATSDDEAAHGPPAAEGGAEAAAGTERSGRLLPRIGASARFAIAAAVALAAFALVYGAFVLTEAGQRVENLSLAGAALRAEGDVAASLSTLSQISVVSFAIAALVMFALAFVQGRGGLGVLTAAVMLGSVVLAEVLKGVLPRPELVSGPAWLLRNSFPSGSAAVAAAIGVGALMASPDRLRWLVLPLGAGYAALVGEATQITGWHRLSDTIGSVLLVVAVACAALAVLASVGLVHPTDRGRIDPRLRRFVLVVASIAVLVGAVMIGLLLGLPFLAAPEGGRAVFLQTSFPLVGAGCTMLAILAFARVLEPYSLGRSAPRG